MHESGNKRVVNQVYQSDHDSDNACDGSNVSINNKDSVSSSDKVK